MFLDLQKLLRYSVTDKSGDFMMLTQTMDKRLPNRCNNYKKLTITAFDMAPHELRITVKRVLLKIIIARTV